MKYKLISMDFDGTLLTSSKQITETSKKILLEYKNNKYIIVGITARNLSSVNSVCDINMFNYLILNNGGYIYDVQNRTGVNISNIDKNVQLKLMNNFNDIANQINYCSLNKYYIYTKSNIESKDYSVKIKSIDEIEETITRMNIFPKDNQKISIYKKFIEDNFDNMSTFEMTDTDKNKNKKWLAINPKEINKFKALEKLCLALNIKTDEVIFFGDSANDLPIISKVGLGVAMGNALKEVKEQAKEITLSNDEDGIVSFLEKLKNS